MKNTKQCSYCSKAIIRSKSKSDLYFCSTSHKARWQSEKNRPVTEEWLRHAYLVDGKDCTQISMIVGRDPKSVWNWLKQCGIETRKRGTTGNWVHSIGKPRTLTEEGRKILSEKAREARIKDGRIPSMIDGKHWLHVTGRKPASWKGGISPERQSLYASLEWREAVKATWSKYDAKCGRCGLDCRGIDNRKGAFAIHHIDSFMIADRRCDHDNLILLCTPCHKWVHSKKNEKKELLGEGH